MDYTDCILFNFQGALTTAFLCFHFYHLFALDCNYSIPHMRTNCNSEISNDLMLKTLFFDVFMQNDRFAPANIAKFWTFQLFNCYFTQIFINSVVHVEISYPNCK